MPAQSKAHKGPAPRIVKKFKRVGQLDDPGCERFAPVCWLIGFSRFVLTNILTRHTARVRRVRWSWNKLCRALDDGPQFIGSAARGEKVRRILYRFSVTVGQLDQLQTL